jgi:hypothetical protein
MRTSFWPVGAVIQRLMASSHRATSCSDSAANTYVLIRVYTAKQFFLPA